MQKYIRRLTPKCKRKKVAHIRTSVWIYYWCCKNKNKYLCGFYHFCF